VSTITCPACSLRITPRDPGKYAGRVVRCPNCRKRIRVGLPTTAAPLGPFSALQSVTAAPTPSGRAVRRACMVVAAICLAITTLAAGLRCGSTTGGH
jgi:hypothetical protein